MTQPGRETSNQPEATAAASAAAVAGAAVAFSGCSGGGSSGGGGFVAPPNFPTDPVAPPLTTTTDASRFLQQATFGPSEAETNKLMAQGIDPWLAEQFTLPESLHLDTITTMGPPTADGRMQAWWQLAVNAPDQLRQRVAFALSEIFVVSEVDFPGAQNALALANYYDIFVRNALGNLKDILVEVTLSPVMGVYLSHVLNEKPDPAKNIRPDENYAREVMQLFTIGLVELNADGTPKAGPIPTYDQEVIEGFAHVFTGWTYANSASWQQPSKNIMDPMEPVEAFHDTGAKKLLRGLTLPAGQLARKDLDDALETLFKHPNTGPCSRSAPTPGLRGAAQHPREPPVRPGVLRRAAASPAHGRDHQRRHRQPHPVPHGLPRHALGSAARDGRPDDRHPRHAPGHPAGLLRQHGRVGHPRRATPPSPGPAPGAE